MGFTARQGNDRLREQDKSVLVQGLSNSANP